MFYMSTLCILEEKVEMMYKLEWVMNNFKVVNFNVSSPCAPHIYVHRVHNDVSSREEKLRKIGLYNPDDSREFGTIRMNRIGQNSREVCTNSPDENGETRQLVREVPEYHASVASRVRDMRVDAVIIHPP